MDITKEVMCTCACAHTQKNAENLNSAFSIGKVMRADLPGKNGNLP